LLIFQIKYICTFYYIFICIYHIHTLWLLFVLIGRKQKYVMIGCSNILLLNWEAMWFSYILLGQLHTSLGENLDLSLILLNLTCYLSLWKKIVLICHLVISFLVSFDNWLIASWGIEFTVVLLCIVLPLMNDPNLIMCIIYIFYFDRIFY
jgi:hypothetical protein